MFYLFILILAEKTCTVTDKLELGGVGVELLNSREAHMGLQRKLLVDWPQAWLSP